ncbi:MAG: hypothetical protein ABIR87_00810 [Sphingomicrobium sp.]
MATVENMQLPQRVGAVGDERFFLWGAIAMALVIVAGFSTQLAMGRSSFASPPLVHAHAIVFMGWITLFVTQNALVSRRRIDLHRKLGWIGAGWVVAMVALGFAVTIAMVRRGQVPFFFKPLQFLVFDPVTVLTFAALTVAAIMMRKRTEWHRRLHFCGTAMLMGPGFGRLLPLPLLAPWAFEATFVATMLFPLAGVIADARRSGRVHPAWGYGMAVMVGSLLLTEAVTYSPVGQALYRAATAGAPGAQVAPLAFPPPPVGPRRTGRTLTRD